MAWGDNTISIPGAPGYTRPIAAQPAAPAGAKTVGQAAQPAGAKMRGAAPAKAGSYDPSGDLFGFVMDGLNGGFDTPGTPGYMVSQQALRDSLQAGYNQSEADRSGAYGGAVGEIRARAPQIQAGYDDASAQIQSDSALRQQALMGMSDRNNQNLLQGAASLGLNVAPAGNQRADQQMMANIGNFQSIADAWQGFNGNMAGRALERNDAAGDSINYQGLLQQAALQQMLMTAMAGAQDSYVGGSGGSSLTPNQRLGGGMDLLDWYSGDVKNDLGFAKLAAQYGGGGKTMASVAGKTFGSAPAK